MYSESSGDALLQTTDPDRIAAALQPIAVGFTRWASPVTLSGDEPPDIILDAYRPHLDALMGDHNAGSADVIKLTPDHPGAPALRDKFLREHRHDEPEIRFFVQGSGSFVLHEQGMVYAVHCTAGDLISVPAGIRHWFDAGERPSFTALRVFTDTSGWVPHYTGDTISERFPIA